MTAVLYSDPNCPFCYAMEERVHALGLADRVQWRGAQHAPHLPAPMLSSSHPAGEDLEGEVRAIRALAPEVEITVPPGKPSTALAIRWGAAALDRDPVAGRAFVHELYRAVWIRGADLSDPLVLAGLAAASGLPGLDPGPEAERTAAAWQEAWHDTGRPGVPQLISEDGQLRNGLADLAVIEDFLGGTG